MVIGSMWFYEILVCGFVVGDLKDDGKRYVDYGGDDGEGVEFLLLVRFFKEVFGSWIISLGGEDEWSRGDIEY